MLRHLHKHPVYLIQHIQFPKQLNQPQRISHLFHKPKVSHHHPEPRTKEIIFPILLKFLHQLTVHASLPGSPPAQIKLVESNTNAGPNLVEANAI